MKQRREKRKEGRNDGHFTILFCTFIRGKERRKKRRKVGRTGSRTDGRKEGDFNILCCTFERGREGRTDPSQCSGIIVDASGKITEINLCGKNLTGKKSIFGHYQ